MNLQEKIEALETEFNEKIKALKAEVQREQKFPQVEDDYWYVNGDAETMLAVWYGDDYDNHRRAIGNLYKTKREAEFSVEKLKVEAELRKFSRPFKEDKYNYFIELSMFDKTLTIDDDECWQIQGVTYFESTEKALQAMDTVGQDRIKKYIFGVED